MNFGEIIEALREGEMVRRSTWEGGTFIFLQHPAEIKSKDVPNMQSLPQSVKDKLGRRFNGESCQIDAIYYGDQVVRVGLFNVITSWSPSWSDILAKDWEIDH